MDERKSRNLQDNLIVLVKKSKTQSSLSIQEILLILSGKGRILIVLFLSIPFCQPLTLPGLSMLAGILIAFFGLRMAFGKHVCLPKRLLAKSMSSLSIQKIVDKLLKIMKKIEPLVHSRLCFVCSNQKIQIFNGLLIFLLGIFLACPLPFPLTNLSVGWSLLLVNLGLLKDDGVFVIIGYLFSLLTVIFFVFIIFSLKIFLKNGS